MTIEIATERSVLVELSAEDLQILHLTYERIGVDKSETKAAWKTIVDEIRRSTGRTYSGTDVEIDMLPSRGGGCLMIVSSSNAWKTKPDSVQLCIFENADALLDYLSAQTAAGGIPKREVMRLDSGAFAVQVKPCKEEIARMREFGTIVKLSSCQLASVKERAIYLKILGGS